MSEGLAGTVSRLIAENEAHLSPVCVDLGGFAMDVAGGEVALLPASGASRASSILSIAPEDFQSFLDGQIGVEMLIRSGRLRIAGGMRAALDFARALETRIFGSSALPE